MIQLRRVAVLLRAAVKTCFDFGQNHQRNPNFLVLAKVVGEGGIAPKKVGEPVGIESGSHFHLSLSIWR